MPTPAYRCRVCGSLNDDNTAIDGEGQRQPQEGNVSLCLSCATIAIYRADGTLREPTVEEILSIAEDRTVRAAVAAIKQIRAESKGGT